MIAPKVPPITAQLAATSVPKKNPAAIVRTPPRGIENAVRVI